MEKRDKRTEYDYDWDDSVYGTGRTQPPKSRGGLVALMLILVIFLCGVVTVLGILNVKLFRQLKDRQEQDLGMSFSNAQTVPVQTEPTVVEAPPMPASADPKATLDLHNAPAGVENIPSEGGLSLQEIYSRSIPSVVSIGCTLPGGSSNGTGVVLTENGYLVTPAHVVEGAVSISVRLSDEREFAARIIGSDEVSDLAVLRIGVEGLTPAQFGDSSNLRVLLFHLLDFFQRFFLGFHRPKAADESGFFLNKFRFPKLGRYQILVQGSAPSDHIIFQPSQQNVVHNGLHQDSLRGVVHFLYTGIVMEGLHQTALGIGQAQRHLMPCLIQGRFNRRQQAVHVDALFGRDGYNVLAMGDLVGIDKIGLIVAFQHRRAGLCQLANELFHHGNMLRRVGVGRIDDMKQQICKLQLLQCGMEGIH